jgi:uncharacterized protein
VRIVIDTNVLISAALSHSGIPSQIMSLWEKEIFEVLVSKPILAEYHRVFHYRHLPFSPETITRSLRHIRHTAVLVEHVEELPVVSADPHDDKFIACAIAGHASYIVSGDEHLLVLKEYRGIPILSPALFMAAIAEEVSV